MPLADDGDRRDDVGCGALVPATAGPAEVSLSSSVYYIIES